MDSGAFTRIRTGRGHMPVERYAELAVSFGRWCEGEDRELVAIATQDYPCDPMSLTKAGIDVETAQRRTTDNYVALYDAVVRESSEFQHSLWCDSDSPEWMYGDDDLEDDEIFGLRSCKPDFYVMPVLQGRTPEDYIRHLEDYRRHSWGIKIEDYFDFEWFGVGSLVGRPTSEIEAILMAVYGAEPTIRLHGFGVKKRVLKSPIVWDLLYSADSSAGAFNVVGNSQEKKAIARKYADELERPEQISIFSK